MRLRITIGGVVYEAEVEVLEEEGPAYGPQPAPTSVFEAKPDPVRIVAAVTPDADTGKISTSAVNGLVTKVLVEPGQAVAQDQLLMVLEAMKMETQVTAPRDCTVAKVLVMAGDSVKAHQPLIEFD